jgi:hypothetical protein
MHKPDTGVIDFIHTEAGLGEGMSTRVEMVRMKAEGNHQAELDAALTRALTVTLWER